MSYNVIRVLRKMNFNEDVRALYSELCTRLAELYPPWGLRGVEVLPLKGGKPGWTGYGVNYRLRGEAKRLEIGLCNRNRDPNADDINYFQDRIFVEFNAARKGQNLHYIFDEVVPFYVRTFGAFAATVEDLDTLVRYGEALRSMSPEAYEAFMASDRSPKNTCFNIWQVNYWASEQCNNYFGLAPEQVVNAVKGQVARADVLEGGAYIVVSYDPMSTDEVELITPKLMPLLRK
ncbi:hypothetical protein [Achromobacter ruhlandii]|uniref:hypothetical protein n=1 Tax=Achromobacter ruhlandii TaxID=72557 RepID=UPI000A57CF5A|nr:hypothetical protein [Achromobacter ruhlandii]